MKKLVMIAPFAGARGNLSGKQDLRYAENDNKAFESPKDKRNYARNYTPRYVGIHSSKTGNFHFVLKAKSAFHATANALMAAALLGASGAVYGALIKVKTTATYLGVMAQYNALVAIGEKRSFQKYCMDIIRQAIKAGSENVSFAGPATLVSFKNPWYDGSMSVDVTISTITLVKFWTQLKENGIKFTINGQTGIGVRQEDFGSLITSGHNILSLSKDENNIVLYQGLKITLNGTEEIETMDYPSADGTYKTLAA